MSIEDKKKQGKLSFVCVSNDFILGLSDAQRNALNEEERKPLLNRFRQVWCPGSTFKPLIAAIGLKTAAVDPRENFGNVGLSWQKDAFWRV